MDTEGEPAAKPEPTVATKAADEPEPPADSKVDIAKHPRSSQKEQREGASRRRPHVHAARRGSAKRPVEEATQPSPKPKTEGTIAVEEW
jgi:hypothetical protein